jgi:hypothetical protein
MAKLTRTTDLEARVSLPKGYAGTTVLIEEVSETELRIRKAEVAPEVEIPFAEEGPRQLSAKQSERFFELLENPPPPNAALQKAAREYNRVRSTVRKPRRG